MFRASGVVLGFFLTFGPWGFLREDPLWPGGSVWLFSLIMVLAVIAPRWQSSTGHLGFRV